MTVGAATAGLGSIAIVSSFDGGQLNSYDGDALSVRKRWGYFQGAAVFPGPDSAIERDYDTAEIDAIHGEAQMRGVSAEQLIALLGRTTYDVPLNEKAYWRNVPERVWHFRASGYTVLKKWLSYRERDILGRPLYEQEVRDFRNIARRIAAILWLSPALDQSYRAVRASAS